MTSYPLDKTENDEGVKEETNNNGNDEEDIGYEMAKKCPICGSPMHHAGELRPRNPLGRTRTVTVYQCGRCKYRCIG
jgi:C4-type Zn-finger protein